MTTMGLRKALLAGCAAIVMAGASSASHAQTPSHDYAIGRQDLATALRNYSLKSGRDVVFDPVLVRGKTSRGAEGRLDDEEALSRILAGTGLRAQRTPSGGLSVVQGAAVGRPQLTGAGDAAQPAEVGELVVTAAKRAEKLSSVGASITALSGDDLRKIGASSFADFAGLTPGLSYQSTSPGRTQIGIRGMNVGTTQPSNTVAIYLDETAVTPASATALGAEVNNDFDTFDMNRIEVLRGPQGTLYGASALAGVIKYVTNQPSFDGYHGSLSLSAGSVKSGDEDYGAKGMVNIPLSDWAALRIVGYRSHDAGFIDNVARGEKNVNDTDRSGGRAILALKPTDDLKINLMAVTAKLRNGGESAVDFVARTNTPAFGDLTQSRALPETLRYVYALYNANIQYDFGIATLTSSTSQSKQKVLRELVGNSFGPNATDLSRRNATFKAFTQEVRLASPSAEGQGLEWQVGAYYTKEKYDRFFPNFRLNPLTLQGPQISASGTISDYEEKAVFANATYYLTPQLDVAAGLRHSKNDQDGVGISNVGGQNGQTGVSSDSSTTWSVTGRYRPMAGLLLYANASTGYRAGGANFLTAGSLVPKEFAPEKLNNYEAGVKYGAGPFDISVSAYFIDWKSIQLPLVVNGLTFRGNNGQAESKGFEATSRYRISPELTVGATAAYTDAEITSNEPSLGAVPGDRLAGSPHWSGSANASWTHPVTEDIDAFAGAIWKYTGSRVNGYRASPNTPQRPIPSYSVFDLRGGLDWEGKRLTLAVTNLFDKRGITDNYTFPRFSAGVTAGATNVGYDQAGVIRPRTVSLSFDLDF